MTDWKRNDIIAKQPLHYSGHQRSQRKTGPRNIGKRDLEEEMHTSFKYAIYRWLKHVKIEATVQDRV